MGRKRGRNNKRGAFGTGWKIALSITVAFALIFGAVFAFLWAKLDLIEYEDEIDYNVYAQSPTDFPNDVADDPSHLTPTDPSQEELVIDIGGLEQVETIPQIPESEIFEDDDVLNILLIGTDERTDSFNHNARSDSMIIVSIDRECNTVRLVSLERGIGVPILDGEYEGQYDLLTHIFRWGGADLLVRTVEHCFKIDVDHYVRLNFNSVTEVIDAIGGIDMELTKSEAWYLGQFVSAITSTGQQGPIRTGMNRLDGGAALAYARLREIDSDWQRVGRQRKVILAVVEELKGSSLLELNALADTVLPLIQTNLTKIEIAELILYAPKFLQASFDQMTIPKQGTYGGMSIRGGAGAFAVDYEINNEILHKFLYEGVSSEELLSD